MSRPFPARSSGPVGSFTRVNGKIRAREVRVIGVDGHQMGVLSLADAIQLARQNGVDLVEIAPNAVPPVCRLVDFGKFRYEQSKKDKESRKHQHANRVKEIQLSPSIDPHDFGVKLHHAIDFLCEEMKVKVTLRFRGREMMHKEFGFQTVDKFINELAPYGHPDAPPRLIGKGLNVMLSPLPRAKRAKNPHADATGGAVPTAAGTENHQPRPSSTHAFEPVLASRPSPKDKASSPAQTPSASAPFLNNPFSGLDLDSKGDQDQRPKLEKDGSA